MIRELLNWEFRTIVLCLRLRALAKIWDLVAKIGLRNFEKLIFVKRNIRKIVTLKTCSIQVFPQVPSPTMTNFTHSSLILATVPVMLTKFFVDNNFLALADDTDSTELRYERAAVENQSIYRCNCPLTRLTLSR